MKTNLKLFVLTPFLAAVSLPANAQEEKNHMEDLYFLVGDWQGRTTLHFPDQPDRGPMNEIINMTCEKVFLGGTVVRCQAILERDGGRQREWIASFNYHAEEKQFYVLYQYGTYPNIVRFPFKVSNGGKTLQGYVTEERNGSEVPVENINWEFSEDRTQITAMEYYDVTDDGEVNWALGFDFEIKKK